jgi:hypothetical protein
MTPTLPPPTRTHLTPAVLTAATGVVFGPLDEAFAVIHDLIGGTLIPAEVATVQARLRTELVRQFPWIAGLRIPEFHRLPDPRFARVRWIAEVTAEHGGCLEVETGTLAAIPGSVLDLPDYVSIVRTR